MDLSIIIPVYNASKLLNRCIDSIFNQKTKYTYEVIFVDDGSTDNSVELIKARKELNIILYQQQNSGPSVARNKGIELAKGEYIAFLDADDYWLNGFIEKTLEFIKSDNKLVAVSVAQRHVAYDKQSTETTFQLKYRNNYIIPSFFEFWVKYNHVCTGSVVLKTEIAKEVGGMREELRATEDWEFWLLLSTYGKWGIIPEVLFVADGGEVTANRGWLEKMKIRWYNAPSIYEWKKRLEKRCDNNSLFYKKVLGIIVQDISYSHILSEREEMARKEVLEYGKYFRPHPIGNLMNIAKYSKITWHLLSLFLNYREYHRK